VIGAEDESPASGRRSMDVVTRPDLTADGSTTSTGVKASTQELLRQGYIDERQKAVLFRQALTSHKYINAALEPLDLALRLDEHRGVAFLVVGPARLDSEADDGDWSHPLVRRQRMTLEQSLLVAILRQRFMLHEREAGVGGAPAKAVVEDLLKQFLTYFEDSGSDARNESRLSNVLDQLKTYGVVSEVDATGEFTIRPLIAHVANPQSLTDLLGVLRHMAHQSDEGSESK
jgi:hypothetical protein